MMTKLKIISPIIFIIALACFLRLYQLADVPPSPSLDEVSIGYNAYSILKTGADEYGTKFPILLRAYDDWRPALYTYLVIPFVKVLGLDVLAVRLPSVILSVLTVFVTYFLVCELFKKLDVALLASFLLAISPWHIYISRLGHEVNVALTFFVLGLLFFFKALNFNTGEYLSKRRLVLLTSSAILFVGAFYSYQSTKVFIPLFVLLLFILFRRKLLAMKREILLAGIVGALFLTPIIQALLSPNAFIRFEGTSILKASLKRFEERNLLLKEALEHNDIIGQIMHNRRIVALQILSENYIVHFDPSWLFANKSSDRHKVPNLGLFYFWEAPLLVSGIAVLIYRKFGTKITALLTAWILLSIIPASITTDAPHAMRTYNVLPVPQIIEAVGLAAILLFVKKYKVLLAVLFLIPALSIAYLYKQYFFIFPKTQSQSFQYALSEAIPFVLKNGHKYDKIVFSNKDNLYQSYMFFLFHSRYDPLLYQSLGGTGSGGFAETHAFGKFEFREVVWEKEERTKRALFVGNIWEFPSDKDALFKASYLDGQVGVVVVEGDR